MGEVLEEVEVADLRSKANLDGDLHMDGVFALCDSHERLRARLERIEQQRDDLRVLLRKAGGYVDLCGIRAGRNVSDATIDLSRRIVAILRATREKAVGTETER